MPVTLTPDELTVIIESLREYRLRADLSRRELIDPLTLKLIGELTKLDKQGVE